jgi:hypothetical protein
MRPRIPVADQHRRRAELDETSSRRRLTASEENERERLDKAFELRVYRASWREHEHQINQREASRTAAPQPAGFAS